MIVASAGDPGNQLVILGIDAENVKRLKAGKPIRVTQESHPGFPLAGVTIMIYYGETPAALIETLKPAMGPDTKIVNAALHDKKGPVS